MQMMVHSSIAVSLRSGKNGLKVSFRLGGALAKIQSCPGLARQGSGVGSPTASTGLTMSSICQRLTTLLRDCILKRQDSRIDLR